MARAKGCGADAHKGHCFGCVAAAAAGLQLIPAGYVSDTLFGPVIGRLPALFLNLFQSQKLHFFLRILYGATIPKFIFAFCSVISFHVSSSCNDGQTEVARGISQSFLGWKALFISEKSSLLLLEEVEVVMVV